MRTSVALCLVVLLVASAIAAPAVAQPFEPINGTGNGTNTTSSARAANGTATGNGTAAGNASTTDANGSETGDMGREVPTVGDSSSSGIVNDTITAAADTFANGTGTVFMIPFAFLTMRFAPLEAAGSFGSNAWSRPPGLWGELYDIAVGWLFEIAVLLFVLMFVLDWFGNLSPRATMGALDRLFLRAADTLHLLFSWPIAWGHFLIASVIAAAFFPGSEAVGSTVNEALGNVVGALGAGAAIFFLPFLLLVVGWLLLKHAGAFVYLVVGLAAYPALVAASIPDHWLLGNLGAYAENARADYPKAAWYEVPTAVVLGIGYAVNEPLLSLMTAGPYINDAVGGALFYPILWLTALYAPEKTFGQTGLADQAKNAAPGAIAGGAAGAATGAAAGASSGAVSGSAAGSASGGSSGAALGAGGGSAAGALPEGRSGGSAGSKTLAGDGGVVVDNGNGADGTSFAAGSSTAEARGTTGSGTSAGGNGGSESIDTQKPDRTSLDTNQRYEPVEQNSKGGWDTVERPRDAEWLVDSGGVNRVDEATDRPLRFRGETDGQLYDLRAAASDTQEVGHTSGSESVRNT